MMNFNRLFLCLLGLICIYSCAEKRSVNADSSAALTQEDSLAISVLFSQALISPQDADSLINASRKIGLKTLKLNDTYQFYLARHFIQTGKIAAADSVLEIVMNNFDPTSYPYDLGKFLNLKAAISAYQHKQQNSVYYYQQAIAIFEKHNDYKQLAVIQFNLANIFFSRLDYQSSFKYIQQAKSNFEIIGDSTYIPIANGILAVALSKLDEPEKSREMGKTALDQSLKSNNFLGQIVGNYALGEYYSTQKLYAIALKHYQTAQELSDEKRIPNLALPIKAAILYVENQLGNYKKAILVGQEALAIAQAMNNLEIQYSLNKNIAESFAESGQLKLAFEHQKAAEEIFKNNTLVNNQETLQKLLIEYESEKKNNVILVQKNNLARQQIYVISLGTLLALALVIFISYRRNVLQSAKLKEGIQALKIASALTQGEELERIRLSNELHDGIASNLVAIKLQLETGENYSRRTEHLALVKKTHQEVRKIAHNLMPIDFTKQDWQHALQIFCQEASNSKTSIHFLPANKPILLKQNHALILYRSIQEFVQNALKHSQGSQIEVQILNLPHQGLQITIEDNGIGFAKEEIISSSNSFSNSTIRLEQIGASLEIDSSVGRGTTIFIHYQP